MVGRAGSPQRRGAGPWLRGQLPPHGIREHAPRSEWRPLLLELFFNVFQNRTRIFGFVHEEESRSTSGTRTSGFSLGRPDVLGPPRRAERLERLRPSVLESDSRAVCNGGCGRGHVRECLPLAGSGSPSLRGALCSHGRRFKLSRAFLWVTAVLARQGAGRPGVQSRRGLPRGHGPRRGSQRRRAHRQSLSHTQGLWKQLCRAGRPRFQEDLIVNFCSLSLEP